MTEPINANAKLLNNNDELVFRLEDNTLQIIQPFKHSERLLESYTLSAAGYPEALKGSPAALLMLMNKQEPELLEANPMPAIVIDSASIQYHANSANSTTFTLNQWTNGTEKGTSLSSNRYSPLSIAGDRRPYEEWPDSPLLAAPTDAQTFADLSKKLYEDGVQGVLPAELLSGDNRWPGLDLCSGYSQLLIKDPTWIQQNNRYYQTSLIAAEDQSISVMLDQQYLDTGKLVIDSQPIITFGDSQPAEQFRTWLNEDLVSNPAMTLATITQLCQYTHPDNSDTIALDPQRYTSEHSWRDQASAALQNKHQGIAAQGQYTPDLRYQLGIDTNEEGDTLLITERRSDCYQPIFNVLPLSDPLPAEVAETLLGQFEKALHGPHGPDGVLKLSGRYDLDAPEQHSTLPIPVGSFANRTLPIDIPDEPNWHKIDKHHYVRVDEQANTDQLTVYLLDSRRPEDGTNLHEQTLENLNRLGDLAKEIRDNRPGALAQANHIYKAQHPGPSDLDSILPPYSPDSQPTMLAVASDGFRYGILNENEKAQLVKYDQHQLKTLAAVTLADNPSPEQIGQYQQTLWSDGGASALIDRIDPDQTIDRKPWPTETFKKHQPIGENWVAGDDGRWRQVTSYPLQNGQPGHRIDFQQTGMGPEGVPIAISTPIGHDLSGQAARQLAERLNDGLLEDPALAFHEVQQRAAGENFQETDFEL